MNENKDCKIVQDLLPNYIEKLTNEETNKYIEEHLNECKECKDVLLEMQKELKISDQKRDRREVKYIKKFSNKMKILKIILLIILIIFGIHIGRNMIIISSLNNKANNYVSSSNYHKKTTNFNGDNLMIIDTYYKDGKTVTFLRRVTEKEINKISVYQSGDITNTYFETGDDKKAQLNQKDAFLVSNIFNYLESNNIFEILIRSVTTNIKTVNCNGKDCYLMTDYFSSDLLTSRNDSAYIDKETGLIIRMTMSGDSKDTVTDYTYEFDTVADDIFVEPDINEYKIQ